ncbi:MAG: zinc-binding dehydrogenase [Peptococcaceae bacterium]|jgi:L-iditol 2-dehydrogenase|nr:zinc-binding dehydrogenase [Peptococcaceae bacterium]
MRAVVKKAPGFDQMEYTDIPEPAAERDLVKIRIAYSGICGTDIHAYKGTYPSTKTPVVLGHEFSGLVTAVGPEVKNVKVGDRVTSETTFATCGVCPSCLTKDYNLCGNRRGIGTQVNGSMAEYVISREESVHLLPANVSMLAAALTEPLACGVHAAIEKADTGRGDVVCVFGAGAIGQMVAQVCGARGATVIVAGVAADSQRLALAKASGAARVVNQSAEDIDAIIKEMTAAGGVDIAFECSGAVAAANKALGVVRRQGKVIQMGVFPRSEALIATDLILHREIAYIGSRSQKPSSWRTALQLMADGTVDPARIVSNIFPLTDWREAFEQIARGEGIKNVIHCGEDIQ